MKGTEFCERYGIRYGTERYGIWFAHIVFNINVIFKASIKVLFVKVNTDT